MTSYQILLVDDDTFFLQVYGDFLRSRGFLVDTASSGEQAVELYRGGRYNLVLVDLVMPGLSGIELIERMRGLNPAQDIIVITSSDDVRTAVRAMRLGVYDYLTKPLEREELMMVIDRLQERATLYDEHARLLNENIHYAEIQQVVQLALRVMQSLDLETVCERLLETLCDVCAAQGAALWLMGEDGQLELNGYRGLVEPSRLPLSWSPEETHVSAEMARGLPVLVGAAIPRLAKHGVPAPALLCPVSRDGRVIGAVLLVDKLGGGFLASDLSHARVIAECGSTAVAHARRFRQLERVGLRDPSTSAYNMTFFVDYLGRELHKARRYRRSFSLVQISIDNLATLRNELSPEVFREAHRRIVLAISQGLRDIDVLARVSDGEMFLLLPEVDFLGGLSYVRLAREAVLSSPFLADIDKEHPIAITFGPAAFPRDGDDVDQLFAACGRRLHEARRSLFRRLHLEDVDFWGAVQLLVGERSAYEGEGVTLPRSMAVAEDPRGLSRHQLFGVGAERAVQRSVLREAARQKGASGWLFLGGSGADEAWAGELREALESLEGGDLKVYWLGSELPLHMEDIEAVTPVRAEDGAFDEHTVVLLLAEHAAYGSLSRRREDGRPYGFHTADWTLVEGLIRKLQDAYHLQRGAA